MCVIVFCNNAVTDVDHCLLLQYSKLCVSLSSITIVVRTSNPIFCIVCRMGKGDYSPAFRGRPRGGRIREGTILYASEFHDFCIGVLSVPCQTFYEANVITSIA
jgi:hypothetical protein